MKWNRGESGSEDSSYQGWGRRHTLTTIMSYLRISSCKWTDCHKTEQNRARKDSLWHFDYFSKQFASLICQCNHVARMWLAGDFFSKDLVLVWSWGEWRILLFLSHICCCLPSTNFFPRISIYSPSFPITHPHYWIFAHLHSSTSYSLTFNYLPPLFPLHFFHF